jgi:hypothetical protein
MATTAKIIGRAELNQKASVATYNLPGVDRGKSSGHLLVGVARAGNTQEPNAVVPISSVLCGTMAVEVKRILGLSTQPTREHAEKDGENPDKIGAKTWSIGKPHGVY